MFAPRVARPGSVAAQRSKMAAPPDSRASEQQAIPGPGNGPLPGPIQAKLIVGQADDPLEHEADRIADQAMGASPVASAAAPSHLSPTDVADDVAKRRPTESLTGSEPRATVGDAFGGTGQRLDAETRAFMEPRLGYDFASVRVHPQGGSALGPTSWCCRLRAGPEHCFRGRLLRAGNADRTSADRP